MPPKSSTAPLILQSPVYRKLEFLLVRYQNLHPFCSVFIMTTLACMRAAAYFEWNCANSCRFDNCFTLTFTRTASKSIRIINAIVHLAEVWMFKIM
jgi:hypothetical protein